MEIKNKIIMVSWIKVPWNIKLIKQSISFKVGVPTPTANFVGPALAQRGADRIHVGPTWDQRALVKALFVFLL